MENHHQRRQSNITHLYCLDLFGGLEHEFSDFPSNLLGMSSSQLLLTPSFFRGLGQPPTSDIFIKYQLDYLL